MTDPAVRFYTAIEDAADLLQGDLIDLFVYFLTVEAGEAQATPKNVKECFEACDLQIPARVSAHLSEGTKRTKSRSAKFIKTKSGYRLERNFKDKLAAMLGGERTVVQTSIELRRLEASFSDGPEKEFLKETIDCFETGANRATIVMCWILTMDHLFHFILRHKLKEFNAALAKNTDKRVKVTVIVDRDDFTEMPESKFIEFCRAAAIVSKDVRKILDQKLGIRNSSAHPSGVQIKRSKVIDFVDDLVTNVILKYVI